MIDEKKLIKELEEYRSKCAYDDEYCDGITHAINEIKAQPKVGEWIPCSERLPKTDEYIWLSFSNFDLSALGRYVEDEDGGAFYIGDSDTSCVEEDLFVNAWMPRIPNYKESED